MNLETLEFEQNENIATITLNRPPLNPLNETLFEELLQVLNEVEKDDSIRVLIVTGKGEKALAAGADIADMSNADQAGVAKMNQKSRQAFEKLENLGKPTIAAVNGLALGGGLELALCTDFRISSDQAKLALPEINLAIIPGGGGTQRLQRLIGSAKAKEMMFFGDMLTADDALQCGLVNRVVPLDQLMETVHEWAAKLAKKAPVAMKMMKKALSDGSNTDLRSGLDVENDYFLEVYATKDREEGLKAFLEKRRPHFIGS